MADRSWYETRAATVMLGVLPFIAVGIAWTIESAHPPQGGWQYAVPNIGATLHALRLDLFGPSYIWPAALNTLQETAFGLMIGAAAGFLLGVAIGLVRFLEGMFYPLIVLLNAVPYVALAPLLVLIFGYGIGSKVVLAAILAFFPLLVNTIVGMRLVRLDEIDLLRSINASRRQIFFRLRLPRALPPIFAGLQVAQLKALLGAVVGEFVGGTGNINDGGLGVKLVISTQHLDIPGAFSALIVLSVIAVALAELVRGVSSRLLWQES